MKPRALLATGLLGALLSACQSPQLPEGPKVSSGIQAAEALARGQYHQAAALYREALSDAPDSLPLHYGLAVSASHIELTDEAVREFRWILEHAPAGSGERETARRWLTGVGALRAPPKPGGIGADHTPETGSASLEGYVFSAEGGSSKPLARISLMLIGVPGSPAEVVRLRLRTDSDGRFRFHNVPSGTYMLTDRVAGPPLWRLRVEITPGHDISLDLTPANSAKVRNDFPQMS